MRNRYLQDTYWPLVAVVSACLVVLYLACLGCPGPNPDPDPDPDPDPQPAGLFVLVVYESNDLDNMSAEQADIISNQVLREWLQANCASEEGQPAFRFLDKDADVSRLSPKWQDLFKQATAQPTPTLLISSSVGRYSGDLPPNAEAMLLELTKYKEP